MHPRKRILKIIDELEQMITDTRSWNDNNRHETPIDVGQDLVMLALHRKMLAAWDAGDIQKCRTLQFEAIDLHKSFERARKG
ncbi:MAG: hypothetical protein AB7I57_24375 [Pirellulales bacterium]